MVKVASGSASSAAPPVNLQTALFTQTTSPSQASQELVLTPYANKLPKPQCTEQEWLLYLQGAHRCAQKVISAMQNDWNLAISTWSSMEISMEKAAKG